ncbi:MAG: sigma-70 family RNA polymerase sigma factor [Pseudomonadales bacterium]|nr:sigma-70 family RNA polymerase sigma factor [Pseudomonadales bacterium]
MTGEERPDPNIDDTRDLWRNYAKTKSLAMRNQLLDTYLPYARTMASIFYSRYANAGVQKDDCMQLASIGLMKAIERYDIEFGVKFETYAAHYLKGEILDGIDQYSEAFCYASQKRILERDRRKSLGSVRAKTLDEFVALTLDLTVSVLIDKLNVDNVEYESLLYKPKTDDALISKRVLKSIDELEHRHRQVLSMHYFYDQSYAEISRSLNISKTRISQIHKESIQLIREKLLAKSTFQMVI